ncbi:D-glycero-beta-D-manno-heptose 1,7-bisphosphate 7-phosphatase [Desulfatiferula olefinivorans]
MDKTVFIDRDGVINRDSPEYIKSVDEFIFLPGSLEALCELSRKGYTVIVITNQSVIGRKLVTPEGLRLIFKAMTDAVEQNGGLIRDIFFCPHVPEDRCDCRKPLPGLILKARDRYDIDLKNAVMIGDSAKDMRCAGAAGVGRRILVRTGNGPKALADLVRDNDPPDLIAEDLYHAVRLLIDSDNAHGRS